MPPRSHDICTAFAECHPRHHVHIVAVLLPQVQVSRTASRLAGVVLRTYVPSSQSSLVLISKGNALSIEPESDDTTSLTGLSERPSCVENIYRGSTGSLFVAGLKGWREQFVPGRYLAKSKQGLFSTSPSQRAPLNDKDYIFHVRRYHRFRKHGKSLEMHLWKATALLLPLRTGDPTYVLIQSAANPTPGNSSCTADLSKPILPDHHLEVNLASHQRLVWNLTTFQLHAFPSPIRSLSYALFPITDQLQCLFHGRRNRARYSGHPDRVSFLAICSAWPRYVVSLGLSALYLTFLRPPPRRTPSLCCTT